jgi:hypothetical protein
VFAGEPSQHEALVDRGQMNKMSGFMRQKLVVTSSAELTSLIYLKHVPYLLMRVFSFFCVT